METKTETETEIDTYLKSNFTKDKHWPLHFNHPIKELYPGLSNNDIQHICALIRKETQYKSNDFPGYIFIKYAEIFFKEGRT